MPQIIRSDTQTKCGVSMALAVQSRWVMGRFVLLRHLSIPLSGLHFQREMVGKSSMPPSKNRLGSETPSNRTRWLVLLAGFVVLILVWGWANWTTVPKFEASDKALKTIDALFTAINSHDDKRVASCKNQLEVHSNNGELSHQAKIELNKCCELAVSGSWESAAQRLYRIIEKQ